VCSHGRFIVFTANYRNGCDGSPDNVPAGERVHCAGMKSRLSLIALIAVAGIAPCASAQTVFGPTPYSNFSDSPFSGKSYSYFHLEDFEDASFVPGWSAPGWTRVGPSPFTDSVDADDGAIDGNGSGGSSLYSNGSRALSITFDASILGELPSSVGLVWTDVGTSEPFGFGTFRFEAYDALGNPIGFAGEFALGDGLITGQTAEDRFWGVWNPGQVSRLVVTSLDSGDWELDHLQFGFAPMSSVPEPATYGLFGATVLALGALLRRGFGTKKA
jgi:hypothetical protein